MPAAAAWARRAASSTGSAQKRSGVEKISTSSVPSQPARASACDELLVRADALAGQHAVAAAPARAASRRHGRPRSGVRSATSRPDASGRPRGGTCRPGARRRSSPASSSSAIASASELTKPVVVALCRGGSARRRAGRPPSAADRRGAAEAVDDDRACLRPPSGRRAARSRQSDALGLVRGEPRDRRADRLEPLRRVGRALHARDREREERRHGRDAVRDARARARRAARGSPRRRRGSLNSQRPIASNPAAAYAATSSANAAFDGRDLREGELHERPGSFASRRRPSAGFVSSFATR